MPQPLSSVSITVYGTHTSDFSGGLRETNAHLPASANVRFIRLTGHSLLRLVSELAFKHERTFKYNTYP